MVVLESQETLQTFSRYIYPSQHQWKWSHQLSAQSQQLWQILTSESFWYVTLSLTADMQVKIIDRNLYNKAFLLLHVEENVRLFILKPFDERKSNNFNKGTMDTPQMLLMKIRISELNRIHPLFVKTTKTTLCLSRESTNIIWVAECKIKFFEIIVELVR